MAALPISRCPRRISAPIFFAVLAVAGVPPWMAGVAVEPPTADVMENSLGMWLVKIPAGEFEMGSNDFESAKPVHRVQITKPFLMGQTEVTQAQWRKVMGTSPWERQDCVKQGDDITVTYVSWNDAKEFCSRLTEVEQSEGRIRGIQRYRLPTEAEWEYVCRADTKTTWSFGDDEEKLGDHAWYGDNVWDKNEKYAHEAGRKKPNTWGLHDMHGNAWEWCSDWYDENYYAQSPAADPDGPAAGMSRVLRGGSWNNTPIICSSARRDTSRQTERNDSIGFRVVLSVD